MLSLSLRPKTLFYFKSQKNIKTKVKTKARTDTSFIQAFLLIFYFETFKNYT